VACGLLGGFGMRILPILALLGAGCFDLELDFSSEGTSVTATARGDGTTEVRICAGPRDLLSCNDATGFTVSLGDQVVEDDAIAHQLFGGRLAIVHDDRPGATVVVTRDRDGAAMSAELPPPFAITSPADGAVLSRREGVRLRWSATRDEVLWLTSSTCGTTAGRTDDDAGTTLRGSELPEVTGGACDVELTVEHRRAGRVGRGFPDDSDIHGVQQRSVHVRLVP